MEAVVIPLAEISSEKGLLEPGGTVRFDEFTPKTVTREIGQGQVFTQVTSMIVKLSCMYVLYVCIHPS